MQKKNVGVTQPHGCVATSIASAALFALSPIVAVARAIRRRRRGSGIATSLSTDAEWGFIELRVDAPSQRGPEARRQLTECIVRIAESLSETDLSYHLVYREPSAEEASMVSIGPHLQALGDRFLQAIGKATWLNLNLVWLCLPITQPLGSLFDPSTTDPRNEQSIWKTLQQPTVYWAAMTTTIPTGVGELMRLRIWARPEHLAVIEDHLRSFKV